MSKRITTILGLIIHITKTSFLFILPLIFVSIIGNKQDLLAQQNISSANVVSTITSDIGVSTYTNPLINIGFTNPDIIRLGDDYSTNQCRLNIEKGVQAIYWIFKEG